MSDSPTRRRPVVLCILDGWGARAETANNAIALGDTPNWDRYVATCPHARLDASAAAVGLPAGQMGNSEVGHMTIGAGRPVLQELPRIGSAIADGEMAANPALGDLISTLKESGGTCHLMGLVSPGGVHSHQNHMVFLARHVAAAGVSVAIHAFLDGRDTPPRSAASFMEKFVQSLDGGGAITISTVGGRYYAMDRDNRWERVEKAYATLVEGAGDGEWAEDPVAAIEASYAVDVSDEFMLPTVVGNYPGMKDGDGLLVANFRSDRVRQVLTALVDPDFNGFARRRTVDWAARVGMSEYSTDLNRFFVTLLPPVAPRPVLGELIADAGLSQLRIAETEKYAHVTFFLNGGREATFDGEKRILVPSPKVATYDLQPAMSAPEVTDRLVEAIESKAFDLIVVNYANGDMVGHTGKLDAAVQATAAVDTCLGRLEDAVAAAGGALLITADHGNCEMMLDADGVDHTAHTLNPVPVLLINAPAGIEGLRDGALADIAPTILDLLGIKRPVEMTGHALGDSQDAASTAAQ
jgi:2,3-bisphosphoglycerate-independent phosphoglycerate mutase